MRIVTWAGSAAALLATGVGIALAQRAAAPAADRLDDVLLEQLRPGAVVEQYVAQIVGVLRAADRAGDGLDRADVELVRAQQRANARASAIGEVLRYDLDGDLRVGRAELAQAVRGDESNRGQQAAALLARFDGNGDGTITLEEAAATAVDRSDPTLLALLALDRNGDGRLHASELKRIAESAFARVDRDGDGTVSAAEFEPFAETVREAQMVRSAPVCAMPPVPDGAKLIVYGGYEGDAVSSAVVGGEDRETNLIDVTIESGTRPLYLVLTSYESMVWRLSGATGRVVRAVVSSSTAASAGQDRPRTAAGRAVPMSAPAGPRVSAAGVVGLPAARVTIADINCPRYFYATDGIEAKAAGAPLRRSLGRAPDAIFGSYSVRRVALPSGALTRGDGDSAALPRGFDPAMWREAARYWPAGLAAVDPRTVVSRAAVAAYRVLPSQMGLAQLIGAGAIERTARGLRIVRPIAHLPPSMGGAHSVKLILARGVPLPPGDPVHSCIEIEDSSTVIGPAPICARPR